MEMMLTMIFHQETGIFYIIQEELQYTGGMVDSTIDNFNTQYESAGNRIIELMNNDPELLTNPFIKKFQNFGIFI